jgi:hypothetical protein
MAPVQDTSDGEALRYHLRVTFSCPPQGTNVRMAMGARLAELLLTDNWNVDDINVTVEEERLT